jgi:hypothetical protein
MPIYVGHGFQIERGGWGMEDDEDTLTLVPADIDAALQITALTSPNPQISDAELQMLAEKGAPADAVRQTIKCGSLWGLHAQYEDEGTHWRVWWLAAGRLHLYVTYNCHMDYGGRHDAVLDWMLSSLRPAAAA